MSLRETESVLALVAENESLRQQLASCQAALADTEALEIGTGERLAKVEQQLAAALAACKVKDEAIKQALGFTGSSCIDRELNKALAIQPDDSALKAWIGEPAGYKRLWALNGEVPAKERRENGRLAWPYKFKLLPVTEGKCLPDDVPLYSPKELK